MNPALCLSTVCWIACACYPLGGQVRHAPGERYKLFQEYLVRRADEVTRNNLADIQNLDSWKQRRPEIRKRVLYTLGLDPMPPKTPLHPRITGELQRDGYRYHEAYRLTRRFYEILKKRSNFRHDGAVYAHARGSVAGVSPANEIPTPLERLA